MYTWVAVYQDGTEFPQLDPDTGELRPTTLIDRTRLHRFVLINPLEGNRPVLTQVMEPGQRFIYRRRTAIQSSGGKTVCHLIGWQRTVHGTNLQHISYVFENGDIVNGGKFNNQIAWMREIALVPEDAVVVGETVPQETAKLD